MTSRETVDINGKSYDAQTGLPIDADQVEVPAEPKEVVASSSVHTSTQKSKTLNRTVVKKSAPTKPAHLQTRQHKLVAKSPAISRFAADPVFKRQKSMGQDIAPVRHPIQDKVKVAQASREIITAPAKPARVLKDEAIEKAMSTPSEKAPRTKKTLKRRFPRVFSIGFTSVAVLLLGGYFTYLNMPTISIRVAAVQAGIDASYPAYRPDGYRLAGPIAYNDGEVTMRFVANAGPQNFTITEKKSSWDSTAVLENYVEPKAGKDYVPHTTGGLTIYTYDNDAAWVNGGILYGINGDAPLTNEQVLHIATSL
jgi:hypothetical protein